MKPVIIPKSELRAHIDEAAVIKHEMTELLRQLEEKTAGHPVKKPGAWRHKSNRPT